MFHGRHWIISTIYVGKDIQILTNFEIGPMPEAFVTYLWIIQWNLVPLEEKALIKARVLKWNNEPRMNGTPSCK